MLTWNEGLGGVHFEMNRLRKEEWEPRKETAYILLLCSIAFLFVLIFSYVASPIYEPYFGFDSMLYKLAGKALLHGLVPFKDIFHQKGASFFFIEAIAELIGKSLNNYQAGTFMMETANLAIILYFLYRICRLFLGRTWSFCIVLSSLYYLVGCFEGGNLTEEFSLSWSYAAIFIAAKYIFDIERSSGSDYQHKFLPALLQGICFAFVFWIRVNNCVIICGCIVFTVGIFCINKQFWNVIQYVGAVFFGSLLVTIPILLFYYANDALDEMIFGHILINFSYVTKNVTSLGLTLKFVAVLVCQAVISFIILLKGRRNRLVAGLCLCVTTITVSMYLITTMTYLHYAQFIMPCISIFLVVIVREMSPVHLRTLFKKPLTYLLVAFIITSVPYMRSFLGECNYVYVIINNTSYKAINLEILSFAGDMKQAIPIIDRDRVYVYGSSSGPLYYFSDTYQFFKYFDAEWLERFGQTEEANEFYDAFEKTPPLWIAVKEKDVKNDTNEAEFIAAKIEAEYELVLSGSGYSLYRLSSDTKGTQSTVPSGEYIELEVFSL